MEEFTIPMECAVELFKNNKDELIKMIRLSQSRGDMPDLDRVRPHFKVFTHNWEAAEKTFYKYLAALAKDRDTKKYALVNQELSDLRLSYHCCEGEVQGILGTSTTPTSQHQVITVAAPASLPPRHELTKFGGDAREWLAFWACFKRYHEDNKIPVIDKYHYLLSAMKPDSPADKTVRISPVCEENYQETIDRLTNQFGRPSLIVKVYVRELLKLVVSNACGKKSNFIDVVTQISSRVSNLAALGVTSDKCADILYPVVESALPEDIFMAWQRAEKAEENLDLLLAFLQKEVNRQTERQLAREQFSQFGTPTNSATNKGGNGQSQGQAHKNGKGHHGKTTSFSNATLSSSFAFCDGQHSSVECKTARTWTLEKRREILREKKCCTHCLIPGHFFKFCKSKLTCELCGKSHYSFMCYLLSDKSSATTASAGAKPPKKDADKKNVHFKQDGNWRSDGTPEPESKPSTSSNMSSAVLSSLIPLQTLWTYAFDKNGQRKRVRIVFDSCCQHSYILSPIAKELQLEKTGEEKVIHELFGGVQSSPQHHDIVRLYLGNKDGSNNGNFEVRSTNVISSNIISPPMGPWIKEFARKGATFSDFGGDNGPVDILIGNDVRPHCFTGQKITLHEGPGPVAEETIWGWVLGGKLPSYNSNKSASIMLVTNMQVTDRPISDLWALDTIGIRDSADKESRDEMDKQAIAHFQQTVTRHEDGRYEVALPWLDGMQERLPNNYFACVRRLKSTTTQLQKSGFLDNYHSLFQTWEEDNMIERVLDEDPQHSNSQYLPHRAVIKLSSATTPVRPVFDASAKLKGNPSLNECVDKGANTLELISAILTRFRLYQVGVLADIKKAFQQISVTPPDREFLRFLWWEDTTCKNIRIYQHKRVPFGVSASPFLLGITLQHHLKTQYPDSPYTSTLLKNMYVDNVVVSLLCLKKAQQFQQLAQQMLIPAQFDLRGWEFGPDGQDREIPVLGLLWNTKEDYLRIDTTAAKEKILEEKSMTQRILLSLAHSLFDPLGFISPFTLPAKLLLRRCQDAKLGWDIPLPTDIIQDVEKWTTQISRLEEVKVPRYSKYGESSNPTLHIFCDASGSAYATVAFLRTETPNAVELSFLHCRSRVAPKTKATIPRLELISCNIGARLYSTIKEDIADNNIPVTFWTDSSTALA